MSNSNPKHSLLSRKVILGSTLGAALFFMIVGVIFWGGFNTALEATNTMTFCISCHEMEENVYREYRNTIHYTNRSGVRATCSDCHVPDPWVHKVVRKVKASNEVLHKMLGSINTPEKFDTKRLQLARNVWQEMKSTDSRECRNCHDFDSMNPENQKKRSRKQHISGMQAGNTCIDCHKGIAHTKVHDQLNDEELAAMEQPDPDNKRPIPPQWQALIAAMESGNQVVVSSDEQASTASDDPTQTVGTGSGPVAEEQAETPSSAAAITSSIDWSEIEALEVTLFYPGQASIEWTLKGSDHGGKRAFTKGDRCIECHEEEEMDIGDLIVSGEKIEASPIDGKRGSIPVAIKAAYDADNLYMQFQWQDGEHAPVGFIDGGKMDPENPMKFAVMLATDDDGESRVEYADRAGCWQTCHIDANYMPGQPDNALLADHALASRLDLSLGYTKYLKESRTEIEIEGKDGAKRGGWDKLMSEAEILAAMDNGSFMDLLRYKSGSGESEDGHILEQRVMRGGQGVTFSGSLSDGQWTVEMVRKLASDKPGDVSMSKDQLYNIGFAIHDDYSSSRFHHVSLGFKLGFDNDEAEIIAIGQ